MKGNGIEREEKRREVREERGIWGLTKERGLLPMLL
jgi:hypothetical protein